MFMRLRAALGIVQYDSISGDFEVNGESIPPAIPLTFAAMQALDHTQYGTLFFLCTDKHSNGSTGGSLWQNDAVGNRVVLRSAPIRESSLATAPDPTAYPGLKVCWTGGGAGDIVFTSDGVTYRSDDMSIMLSNTLADIPHSGTYTTEQLLKSILIPVDVNNKSILQDGDALIVYEAWGQKTGTANAMTRRYLLGTSTTVGDYTNAASGQVLTTTDAAGSALSRADKFMRIRRLSATTVRVDGVSAASGTLNVGGVFSAARNTTVVTTTSFDSATPPSWHYGLKLDGTTDTALNLLSGYRFGIERGY
jgi:hypothetical protein